MKFLELVNKCLVELNYKKVNSFQELIKNDHQKIKNILNIINAEICMFDNWNFLLRQGELILPKNVGEVKNTINGRIKALSVEGVKYEFSSDFEAFLFNNNSEKTYSALNDMLLLPLFNKDTKVDVVYYTSNFAKSAAGEEKTKLMEGDDETLIPEPFAEPLLVYGTCMRMKANPEYAKFNYWLAMYNNALANMRTNLSVSANETPKIIINRI